MIISVINQKVAITRQYLNQCKFLKTCSKTLSPEPKLLSSLFENTLIAARLLDQGKRNKEKRMLFVFLSASRKKKGNDVTFEPLNFKKANLKLIHSLKNVS